MKKLRFPLLKKGKHITAVVYKTVASQKRKYRQSTQRAETAGKHQDAQAFHSSIAGNYAVEI